jgi:recombination protein RecT
VTLATAPRGRQQQPQKGVAVRSESDVLKALDAEITRRAEVIEDSAASLIDTRRLKGVVLSVFTRRPELWECDPISVARAVVECAQVGLEPTGAIGGAHLVPFFNSKTGKKEVQLILDYRGGVALARRSGEVKRVEARIVRDKDEFDFAYGLDPTLRHVPALVEDPGKLAYCYAVAIFADGSRQFDVMSAVQVEDVRKRSKAKDSGPWVSDYFEMAKKTVLKRLLKLLPLSIEARQVLEFEDEQDREPDVRVHDRSAQMRSTLRDKVARGFTDAGQVAAGAAETAEEAETDTDSTDAVEAETRAVCGHVDPSTMELGECVLDLHDSGPHRNAEGSTWPRA